MFALVLVIQCNVIGCYATRIWNIHLICNDNDTTYRLILLIHIPDTKVSGFDQIETAKRHLQYRLTSQIILKVIKTTIYMSIDVCLGETCLACLVILTTYATMPHNNIVCACGFFGEREKEKKTNINTKRSKNIMHAIIIGNDVQMKLSACIRLAFFELIRMDHFPISYFVFRIWLNVFWILLNHCSYGRTHAHLYYTYSWCCLCLLSLPYNGNRYEQMYGKKVFIDEIGQETQREIILRTCYMHDTQF